MIIRSPFKDYYDFVAGRYGGGDPRVVYVRSAVGAQQRRDYKSFERTMEQHRHLALFHREFFYEDNNLYLGARDERLVIDRALLVFCGKCFPLISSREHPEKGPSWILDVEMMERREPKFTDKWSRRGKYPEFGVEEEPWIGLCRAMRAPVFVIVQRDQGEIGVEGLVPKLNKVGLPALISAEQAYQQIAYYVGNVCRESVDVKPPVEVGNKDRIVGHGFDLVTSFRGRRV